MSNDTPWIGVDLDGTLAHYDHLEAWDHIGPPITPMVNRIRGWLNEDKKVKIFTARACDVTNRCYLTGARFTLDDITHVVQNWCEKHVRRGWRPEVTALKDYFMVQLWDDRAVQVIPNRGITPIDEFEADYLARHGKAWRPK